MKKRASGFTVVEIIVVVACIGILATVATMSYSGYLNKSKKSTFDSNAQQVKLKLGEYFTDNNRYPKDEPTLCSYLGAGTTLHTEFCVTNAAAYAYVASASTPPPVVACLNATDTPPATPACTTYTITVTAPNWGGPVGEPSIIVSP